MAKIVFIGAGSTVFARTMMGDILSFPALQDSTLTLYDINSQRLRTSEIVARRVAAGMKGAPVIETTTDRRAALTGADYVLCMIQVGGYMPATVTDFEIPAKYGLRQTIADTLGIGGIMRGLRTIPVLLGIVRDMEQLCPDATFINYVNPMAMNCWALGRSTSIRTVGLCHSVPYTAEDIAHDLEIPVAEMDYLVGGINHVAFFLRLEHNGEDLYPRLREFARTQEAPRRHPWGLSDGVRYEIFRRLGYFVTESSEHFSEYVPWFIKRDRPDLIEKFHVPLDEYIRRCKLQIEGWEMMRDALETSDEPLESELSVDFGSRLINAMETGVQTTIYGNVPNRGLIANLPDDCCVEVPCLVDGNGVQPTRVGKLPPQLAALMQSNINVQSLTVEAALTGKREHIYHAAMLDPHTAAELDLDQIHALVDELIEAHGDLLPAYH